MNIGFIIDRIDSPSAGTEKQLLALIDGVKGEGFKPRLFLLSDSEWVKEEFSACPCYVLGVDKVKSISAFSGTLHLAKLLRENKIEILQTFFHRANLIGVLGAKLAGVPYIIGTRRNAGYWHDKINFPVHKFLNRFQAAFIANSEWTKNWAVQREDIPASRIEVIHNGIDSDGFSQLGSEGALELRSALGIAHDAPVVGIVANLRPVKRLDIFLRAASLIVQALPDARFLVVGTGPERERLEELANELDLSEAVIFVGSRLDVPALLKVMDIGVLTSDSESFSNSIVEYMHAGLPVVCTEAGGCREAVIDGDNGYVVPLGDYSALAGKVVAVLGSDGRHALGRRGRELAGQRFDMVQSLDKHCRFYKKLLRGE